MKALKLSQIQLFCVQNTLLLVLGSGILAAGETSAFEKSAYFNALASVKSIVATYELTHMVQSDSGPKEVVTVIKFQWSDNGFLYYGAPKVKSGSDFLSPYHQFLCFNEGKQLYSFTSEGLGIREWKKEKDEKFIEQFFKDNANSLCAQPEDFIALTKKYYEGIYNGFFSRNIAMAAPPFLIAGQTLLFSDGISPVRDFKPGFLGKNSIAMFSGPLVRVEGGGTEFLLEPFNKSRNSDFWTEKLKLKCAQNGAPMLLNVALTPRKGLNANKVLPICQYTDSALTSVEKTFGVDVFNTEYGSKDKKQWSIVVKELSINGKKPDFVSEGADPSRYQKIIDLDTGMNIEQ